MQSFADREAVLLANYATFSSKSAGRKHPESDHPYRGPYQRDRDRILHSHAFRRLNGKMQVFTGEMGDYHRTRLTHTMEVASIARTLGRALRLNEDLIEALALLHDIGHPPFGHAGEDILNECLSNAGGFSHNQFALTLVEEIEQPYVGFQGLNLSAEVLAGQRSRIDKSSSSVPSFEVQVVDLADSITYDAHDVDDAIQLGLITVDQLSPLSLIKKCHQEMPIRSEVLGPTNVGRQIARQLIDLQVTDLLTNSERLIHTIEATPNRTADIRLSQSHDFRDEKAELEGFLYTNVYRHPRLIEVRQLAQRQVREMIGALSAQPSLMPEEFAQRTKTLGPLRGAADYIASLTDQGCQSCHKRIFGRDICSSPTAGE